MFVFEADEYSRDERTQARCAGDEFETRKKSKKCFELQARRRGAEKQKRVASWRRTAEHREMIRDDDSLCHLLSPGRVRVQRRRAEGFIDFQRQDPSETE